jgi:L-lysine 6-transaminase
MTLTPNDVRPTLAKFMLADGFEHVVDLNKSHGSMLVDARDGQEYLDLFSMFASMPVGFNHPKILAAKDRLAAVALNKPANSDFYTVEMADFVKTFYTVAIPAEFLHSFYIDGGALGIENALKASFDWKIRKNFTKGAKQELGNQVIHFQQAFHGRTGYTLSLTNTADPRKTIYFPKFNWPRVVNPKLAFPLTVDSVQLTEKLEQQAIDQIKVAIKERGQDIAALIMEPIQGEGGDNHFRPEFFKQLRQICDENEIMLIFDEVQSGVALTGKMWAWQHFGVKPDMFCFGKKTQVCGFVSTKRIDDVEKNVFHESSRINSTWGGNLTDMVRSNIYFKIIHDEKLVDLAAKNGAYLLQKVEALAEEYPTIISNARGRGLMCAFDVVTPEKRDQLQEKIVNNGAIILACGTHSIRFRPPLNISTQEIDLGMEIIRKSVREIG